MRVVPIIIPFYKAHEKLRKCLAAIESQSHPGCETFVRDNSEDNILFTAAVNEGLARYCYRDDVDHVVVLNQDAYMHPDCVRHLVEFMDAHPECGIACPLQYDEEAGGMERGPGNTLTVRSGKVVTWGGSLQAFPFGKHRKDAFASYKEPFETFWANGACMMIRTRVVREVGVFDRNLRFICSDSDFSFTARSRGWKIHVVPRALARHSLGASSADADPAITLVKCRDAVYFTEKWLTGGLYRRLAFEGADLTGIDVRQWLRRLKREIEVLERRLGAAEPGRPGSYPSWVSEFRQPPRQRGPGRF